MVEVRLVRGGDLSHVITMFAESAEPFPHRVDDAVTVEGVFQLSSLETLSNSRNPCGGFGLGAFYQLIYHLLSPSMILPFLSVSPLLTPLWSLLIAQALLCHSCK